MKHAGEQELRDFAEGLYAQHGIRITAVQNRTIRDLWAAAEAAGGPPTLATYRRVTTPDARLQDAARDPSALAILATVTVQDGGAGTFLRALPPVVAGTRAEASNRSYEILQSLTNPNEFVAVEVWSGPEAIDPHFATPHVTAFLAEVGKVEPRKRTFVPIKGEIPSPLAPPPGCHFHPRCPYAMPVCRERVPPLDEVAPAHRSACWLNREPASDGPGTMDPA